MKKPKRNKTSFSINSKKSIKKTVNKEEKQFAKDIDGFRTPNSGAIKFLPGDVIKGDNIIDLKSTDHTQIVVNEKMLQKIEHEGQKMSKKPIIILFFRKTKKLKNKKWILMPYEN